MSSRRTHLRPTPEVEAVWERTVAKAREDELPMVTPASDGSFTFTSLKMVVVLHNKYFPESCVSLKQLASACEKYQSDTVDTSFQEYLDRLRVKEQREERRRWTGARIEKSGVGADVRQSLSIGTNILVTMLTGFIAFWYAGKRAFEGDESKAIIAGLIGLIGALLVEVWLFIIRTEGPAYTASLKRAEAGMRAQKAD